MKKDEQFTFFYVKGIVIQHGLGIDNTSKDISLERIVGEGHIIYAGRLLCKESREALKNRLKGTSVKVSKTREQGVPLCATCQHEYKKIFSSAWVTWVNGLPVNG